MDVTSKPKEVLEILNENVGRTAYLMLNYQPLLYGTISAEDNEKVIVTVNNNTTAYLYKFNGTYDIEKIELEVKNDGVNT